MPARLHLQRVAENAGAGVRGRPQPDNLRPQVHGAVITITRAVMKGDVDGHSVAVIAITVPTFATKARLS